MNLLFAACPPSMCVYRCGLHCLSVSVTACVCVSTWKMRNVYMHLRGCEWMVMFSASKAHLNWTKSVTHSSVHECLLHVCERACEWVSSLSHRLMGTRRIHAKGLPGAWSQAFYMETVRNCYVSRLRRSISAFPLAHMCTHIQSALTHIFTEHAHSLILSVFSLGCSLFAHFHVKRILITHAHCSKVASAQHSTLFHASPRMTDSKQHFLPFFFSMENSCPYITL